MLAETCGARSAIATVNGTAALHVALVGLGVGAGDAVICPALTFVATANAISYSGATPIFADSSEETLGLCPAKLSRFLDCDCEMSGDRLIHTASGLRIAAVMPVHLFGHPVDMDEMLALAAGYNLPVIEDATESLGSRYRDMPTGAIGTVGVLSFNGNKIITSGGGGAVVTNDETLAAKIRHLATTARQDRGWQHDHDMVGFNYRMPNLNAALGLGQLENLREFTATKRRLAKMYHELYADCGGATVFSEQSWAESNYWLNALLLEGRSARDAFLDDVNGRGIQVRPCWRLMSELSIYRHCPVADELDIARDIESRLVNLPSSAKILAPEGAAS